MANRRISRNKSFASYVNSINQDVNALKSTNTGGSISAGAISGENLSETVTLFGSSIQSNNYAPGAAGWKIDGTGVAEFADVYVRGDINAETGTIGYWNISPVDATRHIGNDRIFGTFLESAQIGINDDERDDGVYVSLYKTYFEDALPVTDCRRTANVATITVPGHTYQAGDYINVLIDQDTTFNASPVAVRIDEVTEFTVSYENTGSDFPTANSTTGILSSTAVTGTAQYFQKDSAGLFVRDYGKVDFDYGYFSSEGVKYAAGQAVNLFHNPSFEYGYVLYEADSTPDLGTWTIVSGSGRSATNSAATFSSNFYPLTAGSFVGWEFKISNTGYYTPTTDYIKGVVDYAGAKTYKVFGSSAGTDRELTFSADVFFSPTHQAMTPSGVTVTAPNLVFTFASNPYALVGDMIYLDLDIWDDAYTYSSATQKTGDRLFKVNAANATSLTVTNPWALAITGATIESTTSGRPATIYHIADGQQVTTVALTYSNASVNTIMTLTAPNHGFTTGDVIYLDANVFDSDPDFAYNNFAEFGVGDDGHTFTVKSTTSTTVVVEVPNADYQPAGYTLSGRTSDSGYVRPAAIYSGKTVLYSYDSAKIEFSNGTTTTLYSVLTTASKAEWNDVANSVVNKISTYIPDDYIAAAVNKNISMAKGSNSPFRISAYALDAAYQSLDPTGRAASANFYIRLPLGFYEADGTTVLKAKADSLAQTVRQTYDNIQLSTGSEFFFGGDSHSGSSWADTTLIPATYSVGTADSWIDISVENGTSSIDHISALTFIPTGTTVLYNPASIAPIAPPSYDYSPYQVPGYVSYGQTTLLNANQSTYLVDSSMLTIEAGKSGYISPSGTITSSGSYLTGVSGSLASGFEMVAYKDSELSSPISSIGVWVDHDNLSYASISADKVYFRDSYDNKTLASDYRVASSGSLPKDEFGSYLPEMANHVVYLKSATNITTTNTSYTYGTSKLGGYFRTGASGKTLVNFGMRTDNSTTGSVYGNVEIRLGTDSDGVPTTSGTVVSNYAAVVAQSQGTNIHTSTSACLYHLLPHTTYYIAFGWYVSSGTGSAYDRFIIVNQIV